MKEWPKKHKINRDENLSDRSRPRFRDIIVNLHDSMKSLRLSLLSYDSSAATETSVRGKGLSNSNEYKPTAGTMENDATLYIKRAESVRHQQASNRSLRFETFSDGGGSSKYSNGRKTGRIECSRSSLAFEHRSEDWGRDSASNYSRRTSTSKSGKGIRRTSSLMQQPDKSVLSFMMPSQNIFSLCILIFLLAVALLAVSILLIDGEGFLGFGTRATEAGETGMDAGSPSITPSLAPTWHSGSPSTVTMEKSYSPSILRRNFFSTKIPRTNTAHPTAMPTLNVAPTSSTLFPSDTPFVTLSTMSPSLRDSNSVSNEPSKVPTGDGHLSQNPTWKSTKMATKNPSKYTSRGSSKTPTGIPSKDPTKCPSDVPTQHPSKQPSRYPSKKPSRSPSKEPSRYPSSRPSIIPTVAASQGPTNMPSKEPTLLPSKTPTMKPSMDPSTSPTNIITTAPSLRPSKVPTKFPSTSPTFTPTYRPSVTVTPPPTQQPTKKPKRRLM